jgi:hypothetical protein
MIERPPVLVAQSHLALEHLADQPGERGILLGSLAASPENGLIRDSDGDVSSHESSVTRKKCILAHD